MHPAGGRILVVDDDIALLKVMEGYLVRLGYLVDACSSGAEAWARVEADPSGYSVALLDMTMPGMHGEELARRILGSGASIRLVVVSGYPPDFWKVNLPPDGRVSFLRKPFTPQQLVEAVARPAGYSP